MNAPLSLFQGYGIELEYMLVDRQTLSVVPICDRILEAVAGSAVGEIADGPIAWSNELALHVIEVKTNGPAARLDAALASAFEADLRRLDGIAAEHGACLLPTAMHPTMDPAADTRLWPHGDREVYAAYDRVFGCRTHGWSNLQSCHLNLPFHGEEQFGRLHAAIRPLLPLLPALAASSPIMDGSVTEWLDSRLVVYAKNQRRIASIIGDIVPEPVYTPDAYRAEILEPMYRDIAPHDPGGILQHEWLNSRGAIPRFDRDAIEIRLLDVQETPAADLAIARLVAAAAEALASERWVSRRELERLPTTTLRRMLDRGVVDADEALVDDEALLRALGCDDRQLTAGEVWTSVAEALLLEELPPGSPLRRALLVILSQGPLSRRILQDIGRRPTRERIDRTYRALAECLVQGRPFSVR